MTDALLKQLKLHEGRKRFPYEDTVGKITIGVGRNLTDRGLSDDEIDYLLNNDVDECVADLATFPWFATLDSIRQRVMVDMRFNLGPSRFRGFRRMLTAIAEKDYAKAAHSMQNSLWARQVKTRAVRLVQMMRSGEDYTG